VIFLAGGPPHQDMFDLKPDAPNGIRSEYVIHDAEAHEVDEHTFLHTRKSGVTKISLTKNLATQTIDNQYPDADRTTYAVHLSDGDKCD
jgi:uncharacterized protein